jgi:Kdo2-lipid IVA lauroyltransferase/acyltransferase
MEGIWLDFFGTPTSTTSIPVRLARQTGAAIIPGYCIRVKPGHFQIKIQPEVAVNAHDTQSEENVTAKLNRLLEQEIRRHPEQWTWGHQRWKPIERYRRREKQPKNESV